MISAFGFAGLAHAATATVTIGSPSVTNGTFISVPITVSNFGGAVAGMDFKVAYDPASLTYAGYTLWPTFTGHPAPTTNDSLLLANNSLGIFALNWFDISSALNIDSGTLITLNFTAASPITAAAAATPTFTGSPLDLANIIGDALPSSFVPLAVASASSTTPSSIIANGSAGTSGVAVAPTVTSTSTAGMTIAQMQALLVSLEAQLQALEAQAAGSATGTSFSAASSTFTRDLRFGMTGADVTRLQIFLIAQNAGAAAQKLKVNGTTQNFASLTKAALIEFQKKEGIAPAIGYFGPITRAWVASHY